MNIMAKKKKPEPRKLSDEEMLQKELEILQNIYGKKEGRKKFLEIQAKEEGSTDETWHDREERKKQERVDKWIKAYQRISMTDLIAIRELFEKDVKTVRKASLFSPKNEEALLDAEAKLDAVVYLINNPSKFEVKKTIIEEDTEPGEQYMLSEFKKSYLEHVKTEKAPKTLKSVERAFMHFEAYFGDKPMNSFVPEDLERYKASRKDKVKDVSINNEIRTIKAAFQKAVDWDRLKIHPFRKVKQIRVAQQVTPSFTIEQFKKLCSTIDDE
jgi:hypothetical protein